MDNMKRYLIAFVCCALLAGCASSESRSSRGVVLDGLFIGDTVEVSYADDYAPGMSAVKLSAAK